MHALVPAAEDEDTDEVPDDPEDGDDRGQHAQDPPSKHTSSWRKHRIFTVYFAKFLGKLIQKNFAKHFPEIIGFSLWLKSYLPIPL